MKPFIDSGFFPALAKWPARLVGPFKQWHLAHQLFSAALLTTVILASVAGSWIDHIEASSHHAMFQATLSEKMALLNAVSLEAMMSRDVPVLTSIVEDAGRSDRNILALEVRDQGGKRLAAWQKPASAGSSPPATESRETALLLADKNYGSLKMTWDVSEFLADFKGHTQGILSILVLALLALASSLVLLTRLLVVRPIHIIHQSLNTECAPQLGSNIAALELQHLASAVRTLLRLQRESKRSERRYRGLFDNMAASCMVLSAAGDDFWIEDINESCRRLPVLGIAEQPVEKLGQLIGEQEMPVLFAALRTIETVPLGGRLGEFPLARNGRDYWLDCHIFALDTGEKVLMMHDVTETKLSLSLRRAKEAAEQASELKSTFLSSMSHEIRTPLNGVLSMIELLRGTRLSHKQRHWVDALRGSGQLLLSTINDILDFSKIEAGRLRLEEIQFSLGEVMSNLLNATAQRAYTKGLELILDQDPGLPDRLLGDPFHIQQILVNLVGNAIKFTERGTVKISLEKRELPGNRMRLCVSVRDTGAGIAPEQIQRIFQPFEQGAAQRFLFSEGTGLGLAISKRLVDAMEGSIGVESRLGEGSLFHFEVPIGPVDHAQRSRWLLPESWERCSARVWVQHEAVRESIVASLRAFGFKARAVLSAGEAAEPCVSAQSESGSCLLVLDEHLIGAQGASLLAELKARDGAPSLFCLYVVNPFHHDKGELDRLDGLPNTAYVMKPVHASSLFNALQELFGFSGKSSNLRSNVNDPSWETLIHRLHARERLSGARILLVEDNLVNREVAVEALSMAGIEVQIATHGQEAVDLLSVGYQYDAVLMDLQMPVMDGFQATQIIRQQYAPDALPIIAMTAGVLFQDRQRSLAVGMNDHVGKPVNMQNLLETLLKWVQPAHPRPFVGQASQSSDRSPLERALAGEEHGDSGGSGGSGDGEIDWDSVELPGLKIYSGLNRLGGSKKLYFKLLKSFAKAHEQSETELLASLSNRDFKTMHRLAHTLKGVALTVGAEQLHRSALLVEKEAQDGDDPLGPAGRLDRLRETVEALIVDLHEAMRSVHFLLRSIRSADKEAPAEERTANAASATAGASAELHAQIIDLLNHCDTRLQEVCTTHATTIRGWFDAYLAYVSFMEYIEHYHFEEARDIFLSHAQARTP